MTISSRDRKLLWGASGMLCALCKTPLIMPSDTAGDRDALIGEEAHIVGQGTDGPRSGSLDASEIDRYDNLLLLCANDHTLVDEQVASYSVKRLLQIKATHEAWVQERLTKNAGDPPLPVDPVRVRAVRPGSPIMLPRMRSGREAWNTVVGSMSYRFDSPDDSTVAAEVCDTADDFLQELIDYGEMSEHIVDSGRRAIRDAERSLATMLTHLAEQGLCAFGAQRPMLVTGGKNPPSAWREAVVVVRIAAEVEDVDPLIAVVAGEIPQN